jgi:hypothetical protein
MKDGQQWDYGITMGYTSPNIYSSKFPFFVGYPMDKWMN